jgi:hypothetical protein
VLAQHDLNNLHSAALLLWLSPARYRRRLHVQWRQYLSLQCRDTTPEVLLLLLLAPCVLELCVLTA